MKKTALIALTSIVSAAYAPGQVATGVRLYTPADPDAGGGLRGTIATPRQPLAAVFALPPDEPGKVYKAAVDPAARSFELTGLPPSKYDLVVAFKNETYEGLRLHRGADTLSEEDRTGIRRIVELSEPFFNEKVIHRLRGSTGHMTGVARGFATFLRSKKSIGHIDGIWRHEHRRALKLVLLEHVGPGWQVAKTREIYTVMVPPGTGRIAARFRESLSGLRVIDTVKDLGELDIEAEH